MIEYRGEKRKKVRQKTEETGEKLREKETRQTYQRREEARTKVVN